MTDVAQGLTEGRLRGVLMHVPHDPEKCSFGKKQWMGFGPKCDCFIGKALALPPSKAEEQAKALLQLLESDKQVDYWTFKSHPDSDAKMREAMSNRMAAAKACKESGL